MSAPPANWAEHVHPHGEPIELTPRLWQVTGSLPRLPIPRNMFVYTLDDGGLLIYSAVAMEEPKMQWLDGLGPVKLILVPNYFHRMQARVYLERYPEAKVICPARARDHVAKEVTVHGTAEEVLPEHGVVYHPADGLKRVEGTYELPVEGGAALLFTDAIFNLEHQRGLGGLFMRLIGSTGFFGPTRIAKLFIIKDRQAYKAWLERQAARDDVRLIGMAHGDPVTEGCAARLREAAARL